MDAKIGTRQWWLASAGKTRYHKGEYPGFRLVLREYARTATGWLRSDEKRVDNWQEACRICEGRLGHPSPLIRKNGRKVTTVQNFDILTPYFEEGGSIRQIAAETGINRNSVHKMRKAWEAKKLSA